MTRKAGQPAAAALVALVIVLAPAGRAGAAQLKSLQSGTTTSTVNGTVTVNINAVNTSKSFLIFQTRHNENEPGDSMVQGRLATSTTLEFIRSTNDSGTMEIQWYVCEFVSGVNVQRGSFVQNTTTKNIAITPVASLSQAFVTWSKSPSAGDTTWSDDDPLLGQLTTTSNLQFRVNTLNNAHNVSWQVIEFNSAADINVQKGSTSLASGASSTTVTLPQAVNTAKTFVLVGYRVPGNNVYVGRRMLRARLTSSTQIVIDRGATGEAITEIVWQAVEMKDGTTVTSGNQSFGTGESQKTVDLGSLDLTRACAFGSVQPVGGQNMGSSSYVGDDVIGVGSFTMGLSGTTLTIERTSTAGPADVGWFVVEWEPAAFTDVTAAAGLSGLSTDYCAEMEDYNGDGYADVFIGGTTQTLFTNDGDGTFTAGPALSASWRGAHWGDFDNDGDPDVVIAGEVGPPDLQFSRNNAGTSFTLLDRDAIGIDDVNNVGDGAWLDVDGDGWLDFWGPNGFGNLEKNIYFNDGDGTFTRVAGDSIGLDADVNAEVTTIADYDGDGDLDILLRDKDIPWLWSNDGDGTFTEVASAAGLDLVGWTYTAMGTNGAYDGAAFGDYDNDGDLDLYACQPVFNKLYENNGDGTFTDVTGFAGVAGAGTGTGSPAWGDYDHDGQLDLFVSESTAANHLYRNNGDGTFTDMAAAFGLDDASASWGADWDDIDNDGDLDLLVGGDGGTTKLFQNNTNDANYLRVRLVGKGGGATNVEGRGVLIELFDSGGSTRLGTREVGLASGFGCNEPLWAHFGGVDPGQTYLVRVHFLAQQRDVLVVPGAVSTTLGATVVPQMITIEERAYRLTGWEEIGP